MKEYPHFERLPKVGVGVMIVRDGKILLGERKGSHGAGTYGWTGGHLKFGETLEQCAKREALEETGLHITDLKLLCISNIIQYNTHYIDFEFLAETHIGEPKIMEPDKVVSWNWYELDNLPSPLFKACELALQSYRTGEIYHS